MARNMSRRKSNKIIKRKRNLSKKHIQRAGFRDLNLTKNNNKGKYRDLFNYILESFKTYKDEYINFLHEEIKKQTNDTNENASANKELMKTELKEFASYARQHQDEKYIVLGDLELIQKIAKKIMDVYNIKDNNVNNNNKHNYDYLYELAKYDPSDFMLDQLKMDKYRKYIDQLSNFISNFLKRVNSKNKDLYIYLVNGIEFYKSK
jgi:hypothetical protein